MKVVIHGMAVPLMLKCIHMDDYGSDAVNLKRAVGDTITTKYICVEDQEVRLVCVCTDVASVDTGFYRGAITNLVVHDFKIMNIVLLRV